MKTSSVSLILLTAGLLAVSAAAQNEMSDPAEKPEAGDRAKKARAELIRRFDKNGDGRLDEAEKARALLERNGGAGKFREQALKRFDKNGDGRLDEAERAEAEKFRAEQLKKFDADGDGQLNDAEKEAALKAFMDDRPAGKRKKDK